MKPCDEVCAGKGIPNHLHQLGREADQCFSREELLFRRFRFSSPDLTAVIKFNAMSVNREKFSPNPEDVLWNDETGGKHEGCGVVQFPVSALQGDWDHPETATVPVTFRLRPFHKPVRCNYPHSEVVVIAYDRVKDTSAPTAKIKPPTVKLRIREHLQSLITIIRPLNRRGETLPVA